MPFWRRKGGEYVDPAHEREWLSRIEDIGMMVMNGSKVSALCNAVYCASCYLFLVSHTCMCTMHHVDGFDRRKQKLPSLLRMKEPPNKSKPKKKTKRNWSQRTKKTEIRAIGTRETGKAGENGEGSGRARVRPQEAPIRAPSSSE